MSFPNILKIIPIVSALFCSCGTDYSRIPFNEEEKKILNIFLKEYLSTNSSLLLEDSTVFYTRDDDESLKDIIEDKTNSKSLVDNFFLKNHHKYNIRKEFIDYESLENLRFISSKEVKDIFNKGNWEEFYQSHPESKGILGISRIGMYQNTALIIAVRSSGWLNASSDIFIYKK